VTVTVAVAVALALATHIAIAAARRSPVHRYESDHPSYGRDIARTGGITVATSGATSVRLWDQITLHRYHSVARSFRLVLPPEWVVSEW